VTQPSRSVNANWTRCRRPSHRPSRRPHVLRKTLVNFLAQRDEFIVLGEAGEGNGAVRLAFELQPDVLLLDLNMPGRSGLEALPEIRAKAHERQVLVLTGTRRRNGILRRR